jgi:protein O-mannosyl-transferase
MNLKMAKQAKKNVRTNSTPVPAANTREPLAWHQNVGVWAAMLGALAALLYSGSLGHGFVLDDDLVTKLNKYVQRGIGGIGDIISHSYRAGSEVPSDSEYMYRPLSVVSFAIEWAWSGGKPGLFHLFNILWYGGTVALLFLVIRQWMGPSRTLLAVGVALLFAVHPVHTEVVSNIKSRDELMSTFFSLLALFHLWESRENNKNRALKWALLAFLLALLSKEGAITLLVLAPLVLYFFGQNSSLRSSVQHSAWLLIPFIVWFLIRLAIMQGKLGYHPDANDNQLAVASLGERIGTGLLALLNYLKLLVWPAQLSWDYSFAQIPTVALSNPSAIISALLHLGLLALGVWGFQRRSVWAFCALAYLVSMALYSNLFMLIGTLFGERLVYVGSIWFCLAVGMALWHLLRIETTESTPFQGKNTILFIAITALLAVAGLARTWTRVPAWKDNETLFLTDVEHATASFRTWQGAGEMHLLRYAQNLTAPDTSLLNKAEKCFKSSIDIRPNGSNLLGLGNVAYFRKQYADATRLYNESLAKNPMQNTRQRALIAYNEWGRTEGQQNNNLPLATEIFLKGYAIDSTNVELLRNLGTVCGMQNQHAQAVRFFGKALALSPNDAGLKQNYEMAKRLLQGQ